MAPFHSATNTPPAAICAIGNSIASGCASKASRSPAFVRDARSCKSSSSFCSEIAAWPIRKSGISQQHTLAGCCSGGSRGSGRRDGQFVAFLSDRDGQVDVWVTQIGSGQFHNLTHGSAPEPVNPAVRTLGFSPDGSLVTFWVRKQNSTWLF